VIAKRPPSGKQRRRSGRKLFRKGVGGGVFAWRGRYGGRALVDKIPPTAHHGLGRSSTVNHFTFGPCRRHHHPVPSPLNLSTSYQYFISNGDHDTSPVCFISGFPFRAAKAVTTPTSNRFAVFKHPGRPVARSLAYPRREITSNPSKSQSTKPHPARNKNPSSTLVSAPISGVTSYFRRTSHLPF